MPEATGGDGLAARGLRVAFDGALAVEGVDLDVAAGEVMAVLGPSGCGKSTLLRAVAGLERLAAGTVCWAGQDLARVPAHRRGFALLFQDGQLFAHRDVAGNVGYALELVRPRVPAAERTRRVGDLLALVGLPGFERRAPATLSGGERQRVALARALAADPRLLLLDEPLSALDVSLRARLGADLRRILAEAGTTALLVTHDHEEAFEVATRLSVMRAGRVVQTGAVEEVWRAPTDAATALFLGYAAVLDGEPARRLLASAGLDAAGGAALALRRSALRVDPTGPLHGRVREARATPDLRRLRVDVDGVGEVDAVAPGDGSGPVAGEPVRLRLDPARAARLVDTGS